MFFFLGGKGVEKTTRDLSWLGCFDKREMGGCFFFFCPFLFLSYSSFNPCTPLPRLVVFSLQSLLGEGKTTWRRTMTEWCLKKLASLQIQRNIFYHQDGKLEPWMMDGSTTQSKTLSYCIINGY